MDMLERTDFRHFEREACYYYLTNFPKRQESGCHSEVNSLAFCEVTTKSVSMKLCLKRALRCRQREQQHENVSVVLSDESSQSDGLEELKTSDSMKRRSKPALRCRQQEHEEISENIFVGLCDADSSQSHGVEEMKTSVSMKLRGRQKHREHENVSVVLSDANSSQSDGVEKMKLRSKPALKCRQQEQEQEREHENISVVLSDTDSSQSQGAEEIIKKSFSMKLRSKPPLRCRQQEHGKVSENVFVGLCDADSSQSHGVEEIKTSDSMKLRDRNSLRGRQKHREHENVSVVLSDANSSQSDGVEEIKKESVSMKLRSKPTLRCRQREHENVSENVICVVLSDTDSRQSDSVEDINVSDIHDIKRPIKRSRSGPSCRLSKVDERPYGRVAKISLTPGAMAEDTLGKLRLMANNSGSELWPRSTDESRRESVLDESSTDFMVKSGPSSPCHPVDDIRCKECERLFVKMRRQLTPKKKIRDRNPASLSCDEWILLKKWHPQRRCHRKKGLLWTSLSHIRKLSAQDSGFASINRTQVNCSRPHVFQQRSLRRCKYLTSIQTDLSVTKAKPRDRKRPRAVAWPPVGRWAHSVKRKSSISDTLSQQLSPLNLSVYVTQEDKLLADDQISRLNADHKQNSDASSKQRRTDVRGESNKQEVPDGVDATRRVLKFDDTPETVAVETGEQRKSPRRRHKRGEIREAQNGFQCEQQEDLDGFRTPTDLFSAKPKINQKKVYAAGNTKPAVQKPNFKSMLIDTLVKSQNQIIKESCK